MRVIRAARLAKSLIKPHYTPFITGTFQAPEEKGEGREEITVKNPATGKDLCTVTSASPSDVRTAIHLAHSAYKEGYWAGISASVRSSVLSNLARMLEEKIPEFARMESMQTGRCINEMNAQLGRLPEWLDYYAALLKTQQGFVAPTQGKLLNYVQRVPLGVVAQITPFNHPLLIAVKKIAPALAAGNSVIVKPSELAPITVLEFAELATSAGVPPDILQVLPGSGQHTGRAITSSPLVKKVDITAGTATGRALGQVVGSNLAAYTAELGGKAPIVIFNDADIESAVNGAAFASFIASGQTCVSGTRLIVQSGIYEEFMEKFLTKVESIRRRMGDPMNEASTMGTIISETHLRRIEMMVEERPAEARILAGGKRLQGESALDGFDFSKGLFYPPTVIDGVETHHGLWREEVFGPVVVVKKFEEEFQGIFLANASKYGLGAALWTQDIGKAHRLAAEIEAGLVWINTHHRNDPSSPWGGMKESGIGRENGIEALQSYSQSKSTIVNIASVEETRATHDWFAEDVEDMEGVEDPRYG